MIPASAGEAADSLRALQKQIDIVDQACAAGTLDRYSSGAAPFEVGGARHDVEGIRTSIVPEGEADSPGAVGDCPGCGRRVSLSATRCGYCWTQA